MNNAGRPRKPTKLKKLTGTFQPVRHKLAEIDPPLEDDFTPPSGLNSHGLAEWNRVVGVLKETGVISKLDRSAMYALCIEWGKYMEAEEKLRIMGRIVKAPQSGYPMLNPYETISGQSFKRYKEMVVQFGMTPASRSRVSQGPTTAKAEHPFEAALKIAK